MLSEKTLLHADLYFRTFLHTVVPLHRALVEEMLASAQPPLELPTRLEDIGHEYIEMANRLSKTMIASGQTAREPDPDDYAEMRIERFVRNLIAESGTIRFADGTELDGASALRATPIVIDALRTALWLARGRAGEALAR